MRLFAVWSMAWLLPLCLCTDYIVTLRQYFANDTLINSHVQALLSEVGLVGWRFAPRLPQYAQAPTDFAVVSLRETTHPSALSSHPAVKHVVAERRHGQERRSPLASEEEGPLARQQEPGAFAGPSIPHVLGADLLWKRGYRGQGVRVAIFDSGLRAGHPNFRHVVDTVDWTRDALAHDALGHGTVVAGVVASDRDCLGLAPDAELLILRVFDTEHRSLTSWFLDALNYALFKRVHLINLSMGGPDFLDQPLVDKLREAAAHNVLIVSATGNDGPVHGSHNHPADQLEVLAVGAVDGQGRVAPFSSRGMTLWEMRGPQRVPYGRVKPDLVTWGIGIPGPRLYHGCKTLTGTSAAAPIVTGAAALLASAQKPWNAAVLRHALLSSAFELSDVEVYAQGAGQLNLLGAFEQLQTLERGAGAGGARSALFALPSRIDLTDCPWFGPLCWQPLYARGMPVAVNVTVYHALGAGARWKTIEYTPAGDQGPDSLLQVRASNDSEWLWPSAGTLSVHLKVSPQAGDFHGTLRGSIRVLVEQGNETASLQIPVAVPIVPTPPRARRLLWDNFHQIYFPWGLVPDDALGDGIPDAATRALFPMRPFDWHGDHPHTNYRDWFRHLRSLGYFVEVISQPLTCFDAHDYFALVVVDTEDEFFAEEREKLRHDVDANGLRLVIVAEWYDAKHVESLRLPAQRGSQRVIAGGSHVQALNTLLAPWGMQLGRGIFSGELTFAGHHGVTIHLSAATHIVHSPPDESFLLFGTHALQADNAKELKRSGLSLPDQVAFLAVTRSMALFTDSSCLDSSSVSYQLAPCFWLMDLVLESLQKGAISPPLAAYGRTLSGYEISRDWQRYLPSFSASSEYEHASRVANKSLPQCDQDSVNV